MNKTIIDFLKAIYVNSPAICSEYKPMFRFVISANEIILIPCWDVAADLMHGLHKQPDETTMQICFTIDPSIKKWNLILATESEPLGCVNSIFISSKATAIDCLVASLRLLNLAERMYSLHNHISIIN